MKSEASAIETLLGNAQAEYEAGRPREAEAGFRDVLASEAGNVAALYGLAVILYRSNRFADCLTSIERATVLRPESVDCHNLRGLTELAMGCPAGALDTFELAAGLDPDFADVRNNLGAAQEALGDFPQAEAAYRRAVELQPDYAEASCNLGRILLWLGRPADSEEASRRALEANPDLHDARINLAVAQQRQGRDSVAEETVQAAIARQGEAAALYRMLGVLRRRQNNLAGAEAALNRALEIDPALADAHDALAGVLMDRGSVAEAKAAFQRAMVLAPESGRIHSNLLLCLNYREEDPHSLFEAHRDWANRHAGAVAPLTEPAAAQPRSRLRIGYVSGDFRQHSVAYFFEPLLVHRDKVRFESFCYAANEDPDPVTERLQARSDHWRWVSGLNDDALARQIRDDGIDILVDLSGHTAGNRLGAFLQRPAPVQLTWCGYPNTTGIAAMDYRIVDAITDPPGAEAVATEALQRLPDCFLCYRPPEKAPEPAPAPAESLGYVTFGSFNNLRKITPQVVALWAALLGRVPASRLVLKARPLADADTASRLSREFERHGVDPSRIDLRGAVAGLSGHLDAYAGIDIALDPFPYNGTTTTCEALLMGVPVVTMAGNRHAGRVGASLLSCIGRHSWIADDRDDYLSIAVGLAGDILSLAEDRAALRCRLLDSPLCDARAFTKRMETAFESIWREACCQGG